MTSGIIGAVIAVLLLFGGGVGGWFIRGEVAPKTSIQNINNDTTVYQSQSTSTKVMQGQVTVVIDNGITNSIVLVNVEDLTNVTVSSSTNTNKHISITNGS